MANAVEAVRSEEMGFKKKKALKEFEVPRSTLKNKVNNKKTDKEKLINTLLGRKPMFP